MTAQVQVRPEGVLGSVGILEDLIGIVVGVAEFAESVFDGGVSGGIKCAGDVDGFHTWCEVLGVFFHDGSASCGVECLDVGLELSAVVVLLPGIGEYLSESRGDAVGCSFGASAEAASPVIFWSCHN